MDSARRTLPLARTAGVVLAAITLATLCSCSKSPDTQAGSGPAATTPTAGTAGTGTPNGTAGTTATTRPPFQAPSANAPAAPRTTRPPGSPTTLPNDADGQRITAAIARGTSFVVAHADEVDPPTLLVASNVGATYQLADLAAMRDQAVKRLAVDPPLTALALYLTSPMYRRMAWRDAPITSADVAILPTADPTSRMEWVWATAFLCDSPLFPADWATKLRDFMNQDDPGGYVALHAGLGLASFLEMGCTSPDVDALRDDIAQRLQKLTRSPFVADDNGLEAAVVLQLIGRGDLVQPEWITNTLDAQLPDGTWALATKGQKAGKGNWHATLLAVWFLAACQQPQLAGPFFAPA